MNPLTVELLGYLAMAGVFSLICGWLLAAAHFKSQLRALNTRWKEALTEAHAQAQMDSGSLEQQLQDLGHELKLVNDENRELNRRLDKIDRTRQAARSTIIEQNSQQARSHARLQQLLQERDAEIALLRDRLDAPPDAHPPLSEEGLSGGVLAHGHGSTPGSIQGATIVSAFAGKAPGQIARADGTHRPGGEPVAESRVATLPLSGAATRLVGHPVNQVVDSRTGSAFDDGTGIDDELQTQVISADELPTEMLDQTLRLDALETPNPDPLGMYVINDDTDDLLDDGLDLSEATIAIEEGALPFRRKRGPGGTG